MRSPNLRKSTSQRRVLRSIYRSGSRGVASDPGARLAWKSGGLRSRGRPLEIQYLFHDFHPVKQAIFSEHYGLLVVID